MVQKHFTDRTKTFYQSANIKILQNIWENKKRKIKNNNSANILNTPSPLALSNFLRKSLKKKSVRAIGQCA